MRDSKWDHGISLLKKFIEENNSTNVPQTFVSADGFHLGIWLNAIRFRHNIKKNLAHEKIKELEQLPNWSWNLNDAKWSKGLQALLDFVQKNGHCNVKQKFINEEGFKLGTWTSNKRNRKNMLTASQIAELDAIPGWTWNKKNE